MKRVAVGTAALALLVGAASARAAPLSPGEVASLCGSADGLAHCGRLVEQVQLGRAQDLARRDGAKLTVHLYPSGDAVFTDTDGPDGGQSYSVWDYQDQANIVVLYATRGDDARFIVLQRVSGKASEVPAEPRLSPDRQRIATADFCESGCANELAIWRVTPEGVRKEATWAPEARWSDAGVRWTAADALAIEYTPTGSSEARQLARRLADPGWRRLP